MIRIDELETKSRAGLMDGAVYSSITWISFLGINLIHIGEEEGTWRSIKMDLCCTLSRKFTNRNHPKQLLEFLNSFHEIGLKNDNFSRKKIRTTVFVFISM